MSATIGLSAYLLRLKRPRAKEWAVFKRGGEVDLYALVKAFLETTKGNAVEVLEPSASGTQTAKVFRVEQVVWREDGGQICGLLLYGDRGRASEIYNTRLNKVTHHKTMVEADMPPFYFRLQIPDGDDTRALMIVQRTGLHGIRTILGNGLHRFVVEQDLMLDISNLTDDDLLSAYLSRGELEEITVIAHKGSNDSRQLMNDSRVDGEKLKTGTQVNVVFRRPKGFLGAIKNVARIARGKREVHELVEVHGLDNPEEVSVKIDFGGKSRSFKLIHPSEAGIMRDITNEVSYDTKTGQPRFDSIDGIAGKWASELTRQLQESIAQG